MNDEDITIEQLPSIDGELLERIDLRELKPLFDADHPHVYVDDPTDQTDEYTSQVCTVEGCGMGRLVSK